MSTVDSQICSWDMNFALTCSQVRLSRRIGGLFRPETIAVMDEKFCNVRHRCMKELETFVMANRRAGAYVCDIDKMLHHPCAFLRVFPVKDGLCYPIGNLYATVSMKKPDWRIRKSLTLLLNWMITVMLSALLSLDSRDRCRHSMGRIFLYNAASISVSWRATSRGSMSTSFSFFDVFGTIGAGGAIGTVFVVLIGASPLRCYWTCIRGVHGDESQVTLQRAR